MYDVSSSGLPFLSLVMLGGVGRLFEDAKWDKDWSRGTAWRKVCIACFLALTLVSFSFPPHEGCSWLKITSFARQWRVMSLQRSGPLAMLLLTEREPGPRGWLSLLADSPSPKVIRGHSSTSCRR